ncbi:MULTISPECIES: membrane protein [unclassified Streptomyces]|uniref:membrane protein n=1 Tax=unclassified Streptomyces TaxID=2593676 RepID=UPI0005ED0EF4|nr:MULTISPECIES: membrane protein [unclassified Streptomyces]APU38789.1 hypothetical protein BSL84_02415 [Streptomyces sp. TN58]KJK53913.1 membrane protein [Streptomyces sp. NRRL F-4428]
MTKLLLSVHVLAAILAIGPIAVAASMFPRHTRTPAEEDAGEGLRTARVLHRICRAYTAVGIAVPVFGVATGARLGVLTDAWLLVSIVLTAAAAALLVMAILPGQQRLLDGPDTSGAARLAMATGVFNLLWAVVVVLMIVRPGSTTGA